MLGIPSTVEISFQPSECGKSEKEKLQGVEIKTKSLLLKSVRKTQKLSQELFEALYSEQELLQDYGVTTIYDQDTVEGLIGLWSDKWKSGRPFGTFVAYCAEELIGRISLEPSGPNQLELSIMVKPAAQQKGYGKEMVTALVKHYLPAVLAKGYWAETGPGIFHKVERVVAQTKVMNPMCRLLLQLGFSCYEKVDPERLYFLEVTSPK